METYCKNCGSLYPDRKHGYNSKFCSNDCRKKYFHNQYLINNADQRRIELSSATVGALHEIKVCIDLMSRGLNIFRALSPSCPCDLIAMNDHETIRVEVTTGYMRKDQQFSIPKRPDHYLFDWLAIVFHNGEIHYIKDGAEIDIDSIYPDHHDITLEEYE